MTSFEVEPEMWTQLVEKWRLVAEAIDGMDDPQGEYLFALEKRVRRLEGEVEGCLSASRLVLRPQSVEGHDPKKRDSFGACA
jgi:hypothetical protein